MLLLILAGLTVLLLTGCSSVRVISTQVHSYSSLHTMPQPPTYRLERLPSQQQPSAYRDMIESLATQALANVGMQRDDAHGNLRLELGAAGSSYVPNWPYYNDFGFGMGYGPWGWTPAFGYYGGFPYQPPTMYVRQVRIVLRNQQGQVVYETSARYDDIWLNDAQVYRQLFRAALEGFPTPPPGQRVIRMSITP